MSALLAFLLGNPAILGIGAAIIAAVGAYFKGTLNGAKRERDKQAGDEAKARDVHDEIQNDVGALPSDAARKELGTWDRSKG